MCAMIGQTRAADKTLRELTKRSRLTLANKCWREPRHAKDRSDKSRQTVALAR
jgi:hypothetical protein